MQLSDTAVWEITWLWEAGMAETTTRPIDLSVDAFLDAVAHLVRRAVGQAMRAMMERVTGEPAMMR